MDQADVFVALGVNAARDTREARAFAIDLHDAGHWIELAAFATKDDAKAAMARAVSKGASAAHLRVRKLHDEE